MTEETHSAYMQWLPEDDEQVLMFNGAQTKLPKTLRWPIVRAIDDKTAVVVDTRGHPNPLWIIDSAGKVLNTFNVNDAIEDLLVSDKWIVVTHFDEWAAGNEGVEVYDLSGALRLSYEKDLGGTNVVDCYCACWADTDKLVFFPYTDFPLVQLDLSSFTQEIRAAPDILRGSHAVTTAGRHAFFHSPYHARGDIFAWEIGSNDTSHVGNIGNPLRGLQGGRFMSVEDGKYSILSLRTH